MFNNENLTERILPTITSLLNVVENRVLLVYVILAPFKNKYSTPTTTLYGSDAAGVVRFLNKLSIDLVLQQLYFITLEL